MIHTNISTINYLILITKYCLLGNIIYRVGGDGGDKEVDFQIFCEKKKGT